ncbi:hypothetical protein EDD85DRAFT_792364 [Armillaria nabsnona]|nr:hypothetical protein EDD85DRAFT_792364 [Armillaria nabsnona]
MSIDGIVSRWAWNQFSSAVQKMCSDLTVYCTVLIAIDVGILAIQSVDAGLNMSGIKIMLYLSMVACLGSITFAFLLQHKYQGILQVSFSESCQINHGFRDNCDTLENIAVVQGLPFGLLYWGYVDSVLRWHLSYLWTVHWSTGVCASVLLASSYSVFFLNPVALDVDGLSHQSIKMDDIISNSKHIKEHSHLESPSSLWG